MFLHDVYKKVLWSIVGALLTFGLINSVYHNGFGHIFSGTPTQIILGVIFTSVVSVILLFFNPDTGYVFQDVLQFWVCFVLTFVVFLGFVFLSDIVNIVKSKK